MFKKSLLSLAVASTLLLSAGNGVAAEVDLGVSGSITGLTQIGRYTDSAIFDDSAAEIVSYDADSQQLFVVNASLGEVEIIDISDPTSPASVTSLNVATDTGASLGAANSVDVSNGIVAIAVEAAVKQDPGRVAFYTTDGTYLTNVIVGALPDMLVFTADGSKVLVANEGEPSDDYTNDPEGSVSIITVPSDLIAIPGQSITVATADFTAFNAQKAALIDAGVRIFGPQDTADTADTNSPTNVTSVAEDLEPEYIALDIDDSTNLAWVALQENNAVARLDLDSNTITNIYPLGYKDHSAAGNELDASDRDSTVVAGDPAINITTHANLYGMFQPDTIATVVIDDQTYLVTANEGDAREYGGYSEESRLKNLGDPDCFTSASLTAAPAATSIDSALAATIDDDDQLGRLKITCATGDNDADNDLDNVYVYGARSFSIWNVDNFATSTDMTAPSAALVYDSGADMENRTSAAFPDYFNVGNDDSDLDSRSDSKGPEPEALIVAKAGDNYYSFVGMERQGGIMVYDITDPTSPDFITYENNRDYTEEVEDQVTAGETNLAAGDSGPEGFELIAAGDSPNGKPLLVVASEVSGTTTIYEINTESEGGSSSGGGAIWFWLTGLLAGAAFWRRRR